MQDEGSHRLQFYITISVDASKALEHDAQRYFRFEASEGCAQAEVDAVAEGQVPVRRAVNIEGSRVGKLLLVAIG